MYSLPSMRHHPLMRIALDTLPTDLTLLHQLVRDMADGIDSRDTEIKASKQALSESQLEIDRLLLIIKQLQRGRFGRSAERLDPEQMAFGLEELEADLARAEASRPQSAPSADDEDTTAASKSPHRGPLPAHLPRAERVIPPPHAAGDACPDCGGVLHDAGATHSDMLDWIPASIRVLRITRPKCACRACGTLHQALASARIVPGGLATPGLVAHVLISRYCDHLPLFRQSQIFARHGLAISRSTLSDWVGHACWWLEQLHERLVAHVMAGSRVFADDTPLPVLDPGRGRTRTGRLWAYTRDDRSYGDTVSPAVVFHYEPDRKGCRPAAHLASFSGILQVDGYTGFEALAGDGRIVLAACWAHARRRFYELHEAGSPVATEALERIGALYRIEGTIRGQPPEHRRRVRADHSQPLVEAMRLWLELQLTRLPGRTKLAEAIRYALGRWAALTRFLDDGRIDMDSNPVERAIRPIALGRKNALFAGSEGGAKRWAIVASLIETAKLNGVEPFAWLQDALTRMGEDYPSGQLNKLLPWSAT